MPILRMHLYKFECSSRVDPIDEPFCTMSPRAYVVLAYSTRLWGSMETIRFY